MHPHDSKLRDEIANNAGLYTHMIVFAINCGKNLKRAVVIYGVYDATESVVV